MPSTIAVLSAPRRVLAGVGLVVAVLVLVGQWRDPYPAAAGPAALTGAIAVSFTALGGLVLAGLPGHPVGRLMLAAGLVAGTTVLALSWSAVTPLAWLSQWLWWPPYGLVFLALLVFPDGRLPGRRWRPVAVGLVVTTSVVAVALAVAATSDPRGLLLSATPAADPTARLLVRLALLTVAVELLLVVAVLGSLARRWRRAVGEVRQQLACLLAAGTLFLLGLLLDWLGLSGAWLLMVIAIPGAMTLAVLRYRLYGLEQVINRTLVWLVMSLLVIAAFVGVVALLRDLVLRGDTSNASLVATGLIAVTFEPLRHRVQRGVNRLLYGDRDEPYAVLARLGDLLERTVQPQAVLPLLTGTIARSLQVPYVAVELGGEDVDEGHPGRVHAAYGRATTSLERFDMVTHGERVGRLVVAHRAAGTRFTPVERRLLGDVAMHASVAAATARLIGDLRDSRERLVTAREEERRRLRRDLHDGLGPTLAGMSMQVRAARKIVAADPDRLTRILDGLADDLLTCTGEVRQLVDQLRPAALDRGLESALRAECQRFDGPALAVRLSVPDALHRLPAAVEVAAYRIVGEALANTARHAGATCCDVVVRRGRALVVEVSDDGTGIVARRPGGVGLDSIRERATELGGDCEFVARAPHGTLVRVRLPLPPTPGPPTPAPPTPGPPASGDQEVCVRIRPEDDAKLLITGGSRNPAGGVAGGGRVEEDAAGGGGH
ncbi:GAF domain-containing sensor histidine kinase [Micromonospora rifamycinica]|uniref:histidine kinase n=1 Tax=Micromonospora rifamycinica TaxID=291594 RepID=A0A1C5I609_9ACTN|nr:histidine kinase [Micromonospora rifamycinica]SCG53589.1 Signal transduction histidine kinase [Micromonospora rifamycinica]